MFTPRSTNLARFDRVLAGFNNGNQELLRSQQQIVSGLRFSRPSEDPTAAARAVLLERRVSEATRFRETAAAGEILLDATASALTRGSEIVNTVRTHMIESVNGTLSQDDRNLLSKQIDLLREELFDIANEKFDGRYVFAGSATGSPPWVESEVGGTTRVRYVGSEEQVEVQVGSSANIRTGEPGSLFFGALEPKGLSLSGFTGAQLTSSPNQGEGHERLEFRLDSSALGAGLTGAGLAFANGGADNNALGTSAVVVDAASQTIQFGGGDPVAIPDPASPEYADFVVKNGQGGEIHLDLTAWTGVSVTDTAEGTGSVSIDGSAFQPIDFSSTNTQLVSSASGARISLDMTGVRRAGTEIAHFEGTINIFDAIEGFSRALRNEDGAGQAEILERTNVFMGEFDRNADHLRNGIVVTGGRSAQLKATQDRLSQTEVQMTELLSGVRDTDFASAVLTMTQAESMLQLAQSSGLRIIQNSLLNFLR